MRMCVEIEDSEKQGITASWKVSRHFGASVSNAYSRVRRSVTLIHFRAWECVLRWTQADATNVGRRHEKNERKCVKESDTFSSNECSQN